MYQLHKLTSLVKKRKKVGRGGARGGTSGKGHKGQKARTGHSKMRAGFEGGQMPLVRRLPKRGFTNIFAREYAIFNLDVLEKHFDQDAIINKEALLKKGMLKQKENLPIKILGNGTLSKKLVVYADAISKPAQKAIEAHGGKIHLAGEK